MKLITTAIEKGHEWVLITDEEGRILYVNRAVEEISGYSQKELLGKTPRVFKSGYHDVHFYEKLWRTIKSGEPFQVFYLNQAIIPVSVGEGRFVAISTSSGSVMPSQSFPTGKGS